ncbi:hypothetical protein [Nocardioides sp. Iso805N]|uniref:hypothetical protein n=1 Tax=Nocardioides sp. Iso805N TaxID=1283287 RepID=UPI00037DC81B|nr:hypothetical protein [Nocardioides sp. Iso805N]
MNVASISKLAATAAAAVVAVGVSATAATAATTYTPSGGPNVNFVGSSVSFTDTNAGAVLTCSTFNLSGSLISAGTSRAYGANAGSLGSLSSSGCTNSFFGSTTVTPVGTWTVSIDGDPTGTTYPATLRNVQANVSAVGCSFTAGGGTASSAGTVSGTFNTSTGKFTPTSSTLKINTGSVSGTCFLIGVAAGDSVSVGGSWTNTPPSGSTAVSITNP